MQNEYYNIDEVDLPPIFLTEDNTNSNENKLNFDRSYFTFIRKVAKEIESHSIPNEEFIYKVDVEFIIDRTGSLVNPQFYNKDNSKLTDIQKLILHTLSIPQKWEPGLKNGKAVNTKMRLFFHLSPN